MNIKGSSTLRKYEKHLNLKNYSKNTIKIYIHYVNEFILSFDKPALHLNIKDCESYINNYNFSSVSQLNYLHNG